MSDGRQVPVPHRRAVGDPGGGDQRGLNLPRAATHPGKRLLLPHRHGLPRHRQRPAPVSLFTGGHVHHNSPVPVASGARPERQKFRVALRRPGTPFRHRDPELHASPVHGDVGGLRRHRELRAGVRAPRRRAPVVLVQGPRRVRLPAAQRVPRVALGRVREAAQPRAGNVVRPALRVVGHHRPPPLGGRRAR